MTQATPPKIIGYAVMRLRDWDITVEPQGVKLAGPFGVPIAVKPDFKVEKGSIGFIEVFDTPENAEESAKFYEGGAAVIPIAGGA